MTKSSTDDLTFDDVKNRKVLFRIHSIDRWVNISEAIHHRVRVAVKANEISEDEAQQLLRFINEHRVINLPKMHIHSHLDELMCWQIPREIALLGVCGCFN